MNTTGGEKFRNYTKGHALMAALSLALLVACGGEDPVTPPGQIDADGDGLPDAEDECPDTPETVNGYQDGDGCPDVRPQQIELSTEIAGTWSGVSTLTVNDGAYAKALTIPISVSVDRLAGTINGFCPDGSGAVALSAFTNAPDASWSGIYSCPPGPWGTCSDGVAIRANMVALSLVVRPTQSGVRVAMRGAVTLTDNDDTRPSACDQTGDFTSEFLAPR
jgi:hypothetical protein